MEQAIRFGGYEITESAYYTLKQLRPAPSGGINHKAALALLAAAAGLRHYDDTMFYWPIDSTHLVRADSEQEMRRRSPQEPPRGYKPGGHRNGYARREG